MVERGVAERMRLKQTFDKRTDELQKQHEAVRNALAEHRLKVGDRGCPISISLSTTIED